MPLKFIWRNWTNGGNGYFQGGLDIIPIKIGHLKGETSGSLDSEELNIEGLNGTQGNEFVDPEK